MNKKLAITLKLYHTSHLHIKKHVFERPKDNSIKMLIRVSILGLGETLGSRIMRQSSLKLCPDRDPTRGSVWWVCLDSSIVFVHHLLYTEKMMVGHGLKGWESHIKTEGCHFLCRWHWPFLPCVAHPLSYLFSPTSPTLILARFFVPWIFFFLLPLLRITPLT